MGDASAEFWRDLFNTPISLLDAEGCSISSTFTGATNFFTDESGDNDWWPTFPLQYVFVENKVHKQEFQAYSDWYSQIQRERMGPGWGWHRGLDYHTKIMDYDAVKFKKGSIDEAESIANVTMDAWARKADAKGLPWILYNASSE